MINPKISNTELTNTFDFWRERTNEIAHRMSTVTVTTDANGAPYAVTPGNSAISGTFSALRLEANTLNVNAIAIGTSSLTSYGLVIGNNSVFVGIGNGNIVLANGATTFNLTVPTAAEIADGQYYLNANGKWSVIDIPAIVKIYMQTSGTGTQLVDSFDPTEGLHAADYLVHITDNNANNVQTAKVLVSTVGGSTRVTEYGLIVSNNNLGYFTAIASASAVSLYFTPTSSSCNVGLLRSTI